MVYGQLELLAPPSYSSPSPHMFAQERRHETWDFRGRAAPFICGDLLERVGADAAGFVLARPGGLDLAGEG